MKRVFKAFLACALFGSLCSVGLTSCNFAKQARPIDNSVFYFDVSDLPVSESFLDLIALKDKRVQKSDSKNDIAPEEHVVYLTFDDGPSSNTQEILDILEQYGVKATWFVMGSSDRWDMLPAIWNAGHQVATHTTSHEYRQIYASADAFWDDYEQTAKKIQETLGLRSEPTLFRFPGGSVNDYNKSVRDQIFADAKERNLHFFDWNADSTDASGIDVPASTLVSQTIASSAGANSCCLLMHDTDAKSTTVQALPEIIEYYQSEGFTFEVLTASSFGYHL